jgi:fructose-1,6-bisphosphatase/inositol monophosphatase family enzyme
MRIDRHKRLAWVEREVKRCAPIALRYFRSSSLRVQRKPDHSPVTAADRLIEERLRGAMARAFPGETILGEEFGRSGSSSTTYWTLDPIDGTRAFSQGLPYWGILIGLVEEGKAVLGLCYYPLLGTTIAAAVGVQAYERTRGRLTRLPRPRAVPSLKDAVIFHGGIRWWQSTRYFPGFLRLVRGCFLERSYGDCYGYLWAFRGCADAVLDYGVKPWDMVPIAALAQATGRALVNFSGQPSFSGPEAIMASPIMAHRICRILQHH